MQLLLLLVECVTFKCLMFVYYFITVLNPYVYVNKDFNFLFNIM